MFMAVVLLGDFTVNCADGEEFPLVPGRDPGRIELREGVKYMEVTPEVCPIWKEKPLGMAYWYWELPHSAGQMYRSLHWGQSRPRMKRIVWRCNIYNSHTKAGPHMVTKANLYGCIAPGPYHIQLSRCKGVATRA